MVIDRERVNEIKVDTLKGKIDIPLVFMFDRIGRRELEVPILFYLFNEYGIDVWFIKVGHQKKDDHTGSLYTFLRS